MRQVTLPGLRAGQGAGDCIARHPTGCFPIFAGSGQQPLPPAADDLIALRDELRRLGAPDGHDLVVRCALHRLDPAGRGAAVATLADCGVTWVLEGFSPRQAAEQVEAVVRGGPPAGPGGSAS